jgi:molybdopterin adenylyltransferase
MMFLMVREKQIGTSAIQIRATAGIANSTYIFCLPGSPRACEDAWEETGRRRKALPPNRAAR